MLRASLLAFAVTIFAPSLRSWELETRERHILPTEQELNRYREGLYAGDEIWVFVSEGDFKACIRRAGLDPSQHPYLGVVPLNSLDFARATMIATHEGHMVKVPQTLKRRLPKEFLSEVYRYLIEKGRSYPTRTFLREGDAYAVLRAIFPDPDDLAYFSKGVVAHGTSFYWVLTPDVFRAVPRESAQELLPKLLVSQHQSNLGLDVDLVLDRNEDVWSASQVFAGHRNPEEIAEILRSWRRTSSFPSVRIPLQEILSPQVATLMNRLPEIVGTDCHATAMMANPFLCHWQSVLHKPELHNSILTRHFDTLERSEPLRTGDLLLYLNPISPNRGGFAKVHSATYIAPNLVFTKNGLGFSSVPMFQRADVMERIYFPNGQFEFVAFRPHRDTSADPDWSQNALNIDANHFRPSCQRALAPP